MVSRTYEFGLTLITVVYMAALGILGLVLFAAVTNADIVWQAEAQVGHPISCDEAYAYRAIDAYFYPERRFQGDVLYLFTLLAPLGLIGFALLLASVVAIASRRPRTRRFTVFIGLLVSAGIALFIGILAYSPVISLVGCAVD
jgi:hypothetical protein